MSGSSARPRGRRKPTAGAGAVAARGEHSIELGGKTYKLRPSFAAIAAIEEQLDRSAIELLRASNTCSLGYADLGVIVVELMKAGAEEGSLIRSYTAERIAELIFEEGAATVFVAVTIVLASAITGGRTASGEAKAVTETATA